jgi:hypothetical protein
MVDLFSARDLVNSQHLLAKIDFLPQRLQHLPHFAMQRVKVRSFIVAKEICASVLLPLNVFPVYVILFLSAQPSP